MTSALLTAQCAYLDINLFPFSPSHPIPPYPKNVTKQQVTFTNASTTIPITPKSPNQENYSQIINIKIHRPCKQNPSSIHCLSRQAPTHLPIKQKSHISFPSHPIPRLTIELYQLHADSPSHLISSHLTSSHSPNP